MGNVIFADHRGIDYNMLSTYVLLDRSVENTGDITLFTSLFFSIFSCLLSDWMMAMCGSRSNRCLTFLTRVIAILG